MHKFTISLILCLTALARAMAAPIGTWRLYQSYADITEISPAGNMCFAIASGALFAYDTTDGAVTTYDKAGTLSDSNISHIAWSPAANMLVAAYDDSNVDIVSHNGRCVNISGLYDMSTTYDKRIRHICIDGATAYLSHGFGVTRIDIQDGAMTDTYQLGFVIDYTYTRDGYLYAASHERGTYRGRLADNLSDRANWQYTAPYTPPTEDRLNMHDPKTGWWWTRNDSGLLTYYTVDTDGNRTYKTGGVRPDGPASNHFYRLYMHGGTLYSVGGVWSQEKDGSYPGEVHVWDGTQWSEFEHPTAEVTGQANVDYLCMDFDPKQEGHTMVGAKSGLYEYRDGRFVRHYGRHNSPLESGISVDHYTIVSSVKYDADGNLWVLNSMAQTPILEISPNGEWKQLAHPEVDDDYKWNITSLFVSPTYGNMWFVNNYYQHTRLYAYNSKTDELTSVCGPTYINEDNSSVVPNNIHSASEDNSGNIWLSTTIGPLYLTQTDIDNGTVTQHKVPRNDGTNLADYLLSGIETRCIRADGANRKWIGTDNGAFLISNDNNTVVQHFTTDNSPIPSNVVNDILVDPNSNMVYIATSDGLCSYASDATQPSDNMEQNNVYAYPNPVTPEYNGYVTITGLSLNADVKIVTASGTLVNQGRSTGGTYRWDGHDTKGQRVASGVYMVLAATSDGGNGIVCKIAVVN